MSAVTDNLVDRYIAGTTPAVMMPRAAALPPLETAGHRYLVTRQGLHLEVRRDWIHAILPMATSPVPLPFGAGPDEPLVRLLCGPIPRGLLAEFGDMARTAMPNEIAAWVIWHSQSRQFKLLPLEALDSSAARVVYVRPELQTGWSLVLDLHSHPFWPAMFSSQDDEDDRASGEVKLCGVIGHPRTHNEWCFRLAAGGLFHKLTGASA